MLKAEKTVVHTTSCPISSASAPISCDIGTLETATGVQKQATKVANCAPVKRLRSKAAKMPINGTMMHLVTVPIMIGFFKCGIEEISNRAPKTINARGVATLDKFCNVLYTGVISDKRNSMPVFTNTALIISATRPAKIP